MYKIAINPIDFNNLIVFVGGKFDLQIFLRIALAMKFAPSKLLTMPNAITIRTIIFLLYFPSSKFFLCFPSD